MTKYERRKIIEAVGNKCQECGLRNEWNGKDLSLQVHNHRTNEPIVLCPNCHSQTDNYGGRKNRGVSINKGLHLGRKLSEEHRQRIKENWDGGRPRSPRQKIVWNKGLTKEIDSRISSVSRPDVAERNQARRKELQK